MKDKCSIIQIALALYVQFQAGDYFGCKQIELIRANKAIIAQLIRLTLSLSEF